MEKQLGDILLESKLITGEQLQDVYAKQQAQGTSLVKVLAGSGYIEEADLLEAVAEQENLSFVQLKELTIPPSVLGEVPAKFAWHYRIMPIAIDDGVLSVAISDPHDSWPIDDLETNLGYRVEKVLATTTDILDAIRSHYGVAADTIERILAEEPGAAGSFAGRTGDVEDLERMAGTASVIKVVNQILHQAIGERATDIHLEHYRQDARLRCRVDGVLRDTHVSADVRYLYPAIISRIKIMSGLDIIERRLPQDGRAKVRIGELEYDLRVSVMPTIYGENIVIRILPTAMLLSLGDLGMTDSDLVQFHRLIELPNGIIFVTGPTGSGKSTTLYAALKRLNGDERKLVTIEDPVEYELHGVSQVQVNQKIGLTFARALRSMLRHDPDVIMVGEIRDLETASIATRAALTGHLVLATLHTNDAAGGVTRLLDIGIEPYLVTSAVRAFVAQRLVRVVCSQCSEDAPVEGPVLRELGVEGMQGMRCRRARGCRACDNTGYHGRTGIYEILLMTNEVRELVLSKASAEAIRTQAMAMGMKTLKQDGLDKIAAGVTSPEEILRVCQMDD